MVYKHRRHPTYTVDIMSMRDGSQNGNGSPCTPLQGGAPTLVYTVIQKPTHSTNCYGSEYFSFFPVNLPQVPSAPLLFCCSIIVVVVFGYKKKLQRNRYKDEIPDFLFVESLEKRRKSKKKKPQRSRYR